VRSFKLNFSCNHRFGVSDIFISVPKTTGLPSSVVQKWNITGDYLVHRYTEICIVYVSGTVDIVV
jgi:hypothetical protein